MKLAIVIVDYFSQEWVLRCLASLGRLSCRDLVWIVVDNSLAPDTARVEEKYPTAVIIRLDRNRGFAAGCNQGIEYALDNGAEFVLLLNPDTEADGDFLQPMLNVLQNNPSLGIVAPTILSDSNPEEILYAGGRLCWWRGGPQHLVEVPRESRAWWPVGFVSGCAMLLRARTLRQVGPLDERYFLYFEDADYVQRCLAVGWGAAWVPEASICHSASCSISRRSVEHAYLYSRNRIWFLRRWSPKISYFVYLLFTVLIKIPGAFVRLGPRRGSAFLRGVWHGLVRSS